MTWIISQEKVLPSILEKFKSKISADAILMHAVSSHINSMYKLDLTVVGLLRNLQSMIYINFVLTKHSHHLQMLPYHPNQVTRMQPHHQVVSQGINTKITSSKNQLSVIPVM